MPPRKKKLPMSKVVSIASRRTKQVTESRKEALLPENRIRELEEDVSRLIDMSLDMEERLFRQERHLRKLVRLLRTS